MLRGRGVHGRSKQYPSPSRILNHRHKPSLSPARLKTFKSEPRWMIILGIKKGFHSLSQAVGQLVGKRVRL